MAQDESEAAELAATFSRDYEPPAESLLARFQMLRAEIKVAASDAEYRRLPHEQVLIRLGVLCRKMSVVCELGMAEYRLGRE